MLSLIWLHTGSIVCCTSFNQNFRLDTTVIYPVEFDRSNSIGLKNSFKKAQKTIVKPNIATYWYNSMLYKFIITNYVWHNDLSTRSNSTGQIQPASKTPLKRHKKVMLNLIWLHTGSTVCCTSFNQNFRLDTMNYLPSRIRPASKIALKQHKKLMLSLIWLHTGSIVCCTSIL